MNKKEVRAEIRAMIADMRKSEEPDSAHNLYVIEARKKGKS